MVTMNIFRILGDLSHTASKCILIWAIHTNQSAEGVSLITQMLYAAVFLTRYLDLFWVSPTVSWWNFVLKLFYILSSLYIVLAMLRIFPRTREREKAWKFGGICFAGALVAAPFVTLIFQGKATNFFEILWAFSIILESVCVLPQLLLLRQTTVPTVIDSFYLVTLGSYRAFYILNWILRGAQEHFFDPIVVIFGIVQTAFYVDFAWVYWTRQRVKLRNGGVVDSEDLSRGWLVSRILGRSGDSLDEERGESQGRPRGGASKVRGQWGTRGISISADDQVLDQGQSPGGKPNEQAPFLERVADEEHEDVSSSRSQPNRVEQGISDGSEWRGGSK